MDQTLIKNLQNIVGAEYVITDPSEMAPYGVDRTTLWQPSPSLVVRPDSVEQVQQIVRLANQHKLSLVPSGGRTGYSGGAVAKDGEVVVSLERMNQVLHFSAPDQSVTVQAGMITQHLQDYAAGEGLYYAVDLASAGSCHIGGNVATNAGGIHVIRYGGTRDQVLGLKVVTGAGDILDLNRGLVKNNCGPDLRHLFIGSEGILGFICEVTLRLHPSPPPQTVMVVAAERIADLLAVCAEARRRFTLSAFEFMSRRALAAVEEHSGLKNPFAAASSCYGLLEFDTPADEAQITDFFQHGVDQGWISDAVIAHSLQQAEELWRLREDISESLAPHRPLKNDVAVKLEQLPAFIERMESEFPEHFPGVESVWFGHLGDGNIHINVLKPAAWSEAEFAANATAIAGYIHDLVAECDGSISAEHGIGLLKRDLLAAGGNPAQLALGRDLKMIFDPNGILNPGKVY